MIDYENQHTVVSFSLAIYAHVDMMIEHDALLLLKRIPTSSNRCKYKTIVIMDKEVATFYRLQGQHIDKPFKPEYRKDSENHILVDAKGFIEYQRRKHKKARMASDAAVWKVAKSYIKAIE